METAKEEIFAKLEQEAKNTYIPKICANKLAYRWWHALRVLYFPVYEMLRLDVNYDLYSAYRQIDDDMMGVAFEKCCTLEGLKPAIFKIIDVIIQYEEFMAVVNAHPEIKICHDLAYELHEVKEKQKRRNGKSYFYGHLLPVAMNAYFDFRFQSITRVGVGFLHDSIEDIEYVDDAYLIKHCVSYRMVQNIKNLSKQEGESYFDFIMRVKSSVPFEPVTVIVKLSDLKHNMSDLKEGAQLDKYRFAYHILSKSYYEYHENY